jgi:hypothetical protein
MCINWNLRKSTSAAHRFFARTQAPVAMAVTVATTLCAVGACAGAAGTAEGFAAIAELRERMGRANVRLTPAGYTSLIASYAQVSDHTPHCLDFILQYM